MTLVKTLDELMAFFLKVGFYFHAEEGDSPQSVLKFIQSINVKWEPLPERDDTFKVESGGDQTICTIHALAELANCFMVKAKNMAGMEADANNRTFILFAKYFASMTMDAIEKYRDSKCTPAEPGERRLFDAPTTSEAIGSDLVGIESKSNENSQQFVIGLVSKILDSPVFTSLRIGVGEVQDTKNTGAPVEKHVMIVICAQAFSLPFIQIPAVLKEINSLLEIVRRRVNTPKEKPDDERVIVTLNQISDGLTEALVQYRMEEAGIA